MSAYLELLKECGIQLDESEFLSIMVPDKEKPVTGDDGEDGEDGKDCEKEYEYWDWGNHVLRDINEPGCQHPFALDYEDEVWVGQFKIHRYSRKDRFRFTVFQLLGLNGHVRSEAI